MSNWRTYTLKIFLKKEKKKKNAAQVILLQAIDIVPYHHHHYDNFETINLCETFMMITY